MDWENGSFDNDDDELMIEAALRERSQNKLANQFSRGIVQKCCMEPCGFATLNQYCKKRV